MISRATKFFVLAFTLVLLVSVSAMGVRDI